ncbi:hypothetical protein P7C73_g5259, partial [Tremellales sp. Uapishka_1]
MSVSSTTTLISPTAPLQSVLHPRTHSHSSHTAHTSHRGPHRRQSTTSHHGPSRRLSEGEGGKRATLAGLTMHALPPKKTRSHDRPIAKASRSESHLPRLSRTTSMTSTTSHTSATSAGPRKSRSGPTNRRKPSKESVTVLSGDNEEEAEEEGWESGEDVERSKGNETANTAVPLRRAISDNTAGPLVDSPLTFPSSHHQAQAHTLKTTGFEGPNQNPELKRIESDPRFFDSGHVRPAFQVAHQQSVLSMAAAASSASGSGRDSLSPRVEKKKSTSPIVPLRSTSGSGLPSTVVENPTDGSPSYPFPAVELPKQSTSTSPTDETRPLPKSEPEPDLPSQPRSRVTSAAQTLRHRASNSSFRSIRSIQSLRAPPHPLNSPTGMRTGALPLSSTHTRSTFASPSKDARKRVSSLHYPPVAPAVVYKEVVGGQRWNDEDGDTDLDGPVAKLSIGSQPRLPNGPSHPSYSRRQTAQEAASAVSKYNTTTDATLYHHSLGYPSTSAETSYLISRFLPAKRSKTYLWEINDAVEVEDAQKLDGHAKLARGAYRDAHESLLRTMKEVESGLGPPKGPTSDSGPGAKKAGNGASMMEMSLERCRQQRPRRLW